MPDPTIRVKVDGGQAVAGANQVSGALKAMAAQAGLTSGAFGNMTSAVGASRLALVGIAAAAGVAGIALGVSLARKVSALSRSFIQVASDAEEIRNKFRVVFGEEAANTTQFLEALGDEVGRSTTKLQGYAASLQDTLVPMGVARDEAARLSEKLVTLAIDVGSFNNVADEEVIQRFASAIVGNSEAVRQFAINLNIGRVKAEAYASGIAEVGKQLTEEQKLQARVNLLFKGTADAQGDAARTSGEFANQMKRLADGVFDLRDEMGQQLIPVVQALIEDMGGIEGVVSGVALGFQVATTTAKGFLEIAGDAARIASEFGITADNIVGLTRAIKEFDLRRAVLGAVTGNDLAFIQEFIDALEDAQRGLALEAVGAARAKSATEDLGNAASEAGEKLRSAFSHSPDFFAVSNQLTGQILRAEADLSGTLEAQLAVIEDQEFAYIGLLNSKIANGKLTSQEARELEGQIAVLFNLKRALEEQAFAERDSAQAARENADAQRLLDEQLQSRLAGEAFVAQVRLNEALSEYGFLAEQSARGISVISSAVGQAAVDFGRLDEIARNAFQNIIAGAIQAATEVALIESLLSITKGTKFGTALSAIFQRAKGGVDEVIPFQRGGIATAPTFFNTNNGPAVFAEAGDEAFLPVKKDPVTGEAAVRSVGGGGPSQNITFNQTFQVSDGNVRGARTAVRQFQRDLRRITNRER